MTVLSRTRTTQHTRKRGWTKYTSCQRWRRALLGMGMTRGDQNVQYKYTPQRGIAKRPPKKGRATLQSIWRTRSTDLLVLGESRFPARWAGCMFFGHACKCTYFCDAQTHGSMAQASLNPEEGGNDGHTFRVVFTDSSLNTELRCILLAVRVFQPYSSSWAQLTRARVCFILCGVCSGTKICTMHETTHGSPRWRVHWRHGQAHTLW